MSWIELLAVLLGNKRPELVPIPIKNQPEKK